MTDFLSADEVYCRTERVGPKQAKSYRTPGTVERRLGPSHETSDVENERGLDSQRALIRLGAMGSSVRKRSRPSEQGGKVSE